MLYPTQPLPQPLRGSDRGTFTEHSVVHRLPEIARRTIGENELEPDQIEEVEQIIADIATGTITTFEEPLAPDTADWSGYISPFLGMSYVDVPWFFAESYFYRRLLAATGFSRPGSRAGVDPFRSQKQVGLDGAVPLGPRLAGILDDPAALLRASLWANRVDLSLWPAGEEAASARIAEVLGIERESHLLVDDSDEAIDILGAETPNVHIIFDNSGAELVADLALITGILRTGGRVTVHVKPHPTFVSDVTRADFDATISRLGDEPGPAGEIVDTLRQALTDHRLRVMTHFFWVSPLPFWRAPQEVLDELAGADLMIVKGDYNYRRLLGDLHWDPTTEISRIVRPLQPVLALRVCKSLTGAGISAESVQRTQNADADWLSNGQWGVIQLAPEI